MSDSHADRPEGSTPPPQPAVKSPFGPGSPFAEHYRPARLGIIHLLAWTAATAVLLKFSMAMEMLRDVGDDTTPQGLKILQHVLQFVGTTTCAAGAVGACILLVAKIRRLPGRFQPGHWLLVIVTVAWLLPLVSWAFYALAEPAGSLVGSSSFRWLLAAYGLAEIVCAGMYLYATLASKDGKRWKICFGTLLGVNLIHGFLYLGDSLFDSLWFQSFLHSLAVDRRADSLSGRGRRPPAWSTPRLAALAGSGHRRHQRAPVYCLVGLGDVRQPADVVTRLGPNRPRRV